MSKKTVFSILSIFFLLTACSKRYEFTCMVINDSGYDITLAEFQGIIDAPPLALNDNDSSGVFTASYEQRFRLNGKHLRFHVKNINDPTGNLVVQNKDGLYGFRKSDIKESPNQFRITSMTIGDTVIFTYTLNE